MDLEQLAKRMDLATKMLVDLSDLMDPGESADPREWFAASAAAIRELIDKRTNDHSAHDPALEAATDQLLAKCGDRS